MVDIPGWAIGVVAILGGLGVMAVLIQLGDGLAHGLFGVKRRARGPHTVIGMNVGTGSGEPAVLPPAALEDLQRRVAELEERLDFAERLLAKRPDHEKLIPPR
jgi:hypothetical protein